MDKKINISSSTSKIQINVSSKNDSCIVNLEKDLTRYYSELAKKWAISETIINKEDYSAKYYAQKAKQNIENATLELKQELEKNITIAKEQVNLAKEQVNIVVVKGEEQVSLAQEAANKAEEIAQNLDGNFANINLSNINENGKDIIKNLANETCLSIPIGAIIPLFCTNSYIPEGFLPCDGSEYSKLQFPEFYTNYLIENKLTTCSYEEYEAEINQYGKCGKFGLDLETQSFKLPTIPDGTFIQQAMSDNELGKCYNAGLPNIEGEPLVAIVAASKPTTNGCIDDTNLRNTWGLSGGNSSYSWGDAKINASLSNSIYGNSDTVKPNAVSLRFFVAITTGVIQNSNIDWNAWATGLQNKINADHTNDSKPYIKETYENENSWYRIWSDNWCEQGGEFTSAGTKTITLLKAYKNTNYQVLTTYKNSTNSTGMSITQGSVNNVKANSFSIQNSTSTTFTRVWKAVGYI